MGGIKLGPITLSDEDVALGTEGGQIWRADVRRWGGGNKHGLVGLGGVPGEPVDVLGALGELAFARLNGRPWSPKSGTFKTLPDVGPYEVRTTKWRRGRLIVRPDDPPGVYVLVIAVEPPREFRAFGWMHSEEVRRHPEWIDAPGGRPWAWFAPQWALSRSEECFVEEVADGQT